MEVALLALVLALVKQLTDFSKYVTNRDVNGAFTQAYSWGIGVIVVWIASNATLFDSISLNKVSFASLNFAAILLLGLCVGSGGSLAYELVARSSARPKDLKLLPPKLPRAARRAK